MALSHQGLAEFLKIVNLSVENHPDGAIFVGDRLMTCLEIDDAQAAHADCATAVHVITIIVGTPVADGVAHRANNR